MIGELDVAPRRRRSSGPSAGRRPRRRFALTRCSGPGVARGEQVAHDLAADGPGPARRADDRDRGGPQDVRDGGDVGRALALLEALAAPRATATSGTRSRSQPSDAGAPTTGKPESWNTWSMRWFSGSTVAVKVSMPGRRRGVREVREQDGRDAVALPGIGDREGDLRAARAARRCRCRGPTTVPSGPRTASSDRPSPASAALRAARSRLTPALK